MQWAPAGGASAASQAGPRFSKCTLPSRSNEPSPRTTTSTTMTATTTTTPTTATTTSTTTNNNVSTTNIDYAAPSFEWALAMPI
ncbi:hypothetical protein TYRP_000945 [Tyrophagus putrescentiae]|nr:hypothetical protein TYRP_000945 [Tyrophagus putrescentiae]